MNRMIWTLCLVSILFPNERLRAVHHNESLQLFEEFDLGPNQIRQLPDHNNAVLVLAQLKLGGETVDSLVFKPLDGGKWDDPQGCVHLRLHYDATRKTLADEDLTCSGGASNFAFHVYFLYER